MPFACVFGYMYLLYVHFDAHLGHPSFDTLNGYVQRYGQLFILSEYE